MKAAVARILDLSAGKLIRHLKRTTYTSASVVERVNDLARQESAEYAYRNMAGAMVFHRRLDALDFALSKAVNDGFVAEFGVWKGESLNRMARVISNEVYGFDSFEGLKEDWEGTSMKKGHFSLEGRLPAVAPNVRLNVGWFQDTLPAFLKDCRQNARLIHIDSDTYAAAEYVLNNLADRLVPGSVVVFDEYFGLPGWRQGEFRAFKEFCERHSKAFQYLCYSNSSAAVILTD